GAHKEYSGSHHQNEGMVTTAYKPAEIIDISCPVGAHGNQPGRNQYMKYVQHTRAEQRHPDNGRGDVLFHAVFHKAKDGGKQGGDDGDELQDHVDEIAP